LGTFVVPTDKADGLALQSRVLTAMLCSFKMRGTGSGDSGTAASEVRIGFGSIPPNAELQVQFDLTYANGTKATPGTRWGQEEQAGLLSDNWALRQLLAPRLPGPTGPCRRKSA
jgi:hypothetical protein